MDLEVTVVGMGCERCETLAENARAALSEVGRADVEVRHVADIEEIADLGVLLTPALIINGLVVSSGKVLSAAKVSRYLRDIGAGD